MEHINEILWNSNGEKFPQKEKKLLQEVTLVFEFGNKGKFNPPNGIQMLFCSFYFNAIGFTFT